MIRTPTGLKAPGKKFFRKVLSEYELTDHHDLERLTQACKCLDEIDEGEQIISAEGRFIKDRFEQRREHPAAKSIRDARTLFFRAVRELALDVEVPESRPPRRY
jgi:phage terminase small subunit